MSMSEQQAAQILRLQSDIASLKDVVNTITVGVDTFFVIWGASLVFFMQAGFTCLEIGSCSVKSTKNMLIKNLLDCAVGALGWWSFGQAFSNGPNSHPFWSKIIGSGDFLNSGETFSNSEGGYGINEGFNYALWFMGYAFAAAAVTICSGAVGERLTMTAYFLYAWFMCALIYPLVSRWAWHKDGWASAFNTDTNELLFGCGIVDFAGSGVVHLCGGFAALVFCIFLGPRYGRYVHGKAVDLPKQSVVLQSLGTLMLWFSWIGFNTASTLKLVGVSHVVAKVALCTTISAATAGVATSVIGLILYGRTSPEEINNGLLCGLASITGACAAVEPDGAFIIGMVAGPMYLLGSKALVYIRIDDVVDATSVHVIGGIWGIIAPGLFTTRESYSQSYYADRAGHCCGILYGCGGSLLAAQIVFMLALLAWVGCIMALLCLALQYLQLLRISKKAERIGIDEYDHGGTEEAEGTQALKSYVMETINKSGYTIGHNSANNNGVNNSSQYIQHQNSSSGP